MDKRKREHVGPTVRQEIHIAASPEAVWNAWAKADRIAQWFVDRAVGDMEEGAVVRWIFDAMQYDLPIEVYEAEPGRSLVFGGEAPGRPPALQEVFVEQEGGGTRLRIANSGFAEGADEIIEGVDSGWRMALATLRYWLELGTDAPRVHCLEMVPSTATVAALQPRYETAEGLASWLAAGVTLGDDPLREGTRVRLARSGASDITGAVLARSETEVLLEWSELPGVLGLKSFAVQPGQRFVALDLSAWGIDPSAGEATRAWMRESLQRL